MSETPGFRYKLELNPITIEQINDLIDSLEKQLIELKKMIANKLSVCGAEMILFKIFENIEYRHAVLTNDKERLATFQSLEEE